MKKLLQIQNLETEEYHNIKVTEYKVDYKKLWGNQERNLVGSTRGTLIGVYANISATTFYLDQDDIEETINLFNQPYFSVKYYDSLSNTIKTGNYTASDVSADLVRLYNKEYKQISFTLTAVDMGV